MCTSLSMSGCTQRSRAFIVRVWSCCAAASADTAACCGAGTRPVGSVCKVCLARPIPSSTLHMMIAIAPSCLHRAFALGPLDGATIKHLAALSRSDVFCLGDCN